MQAIRLRRGATGLLVLMALVLLASTWAMQAVHPGFVWVQAFAEAALVGGLADWFAVTALFRHPMGIPIPHTAIIPRSKDRIGDALATFLKDNFLTPRNVARRLDGNGQDRGPPLGRGKLAVLEVPFRPGHAERAG